MADDNAQKSLGMESDTSQNEKLAGAPYTSVNPLDLPDPDANLSAEERKVIVSSPNDRSLYFLTDFQDRKLVWKLDLYLIPWVSFHIESEKNES
jgi:hypothetical protein